MTREESVAIILAAYGNIDRSQITIERDTVTGVEKATVLLRAHQLDHALRDNCRHIRQAAMKTGINIETGLEPAG